MEDQNFTTSIEVNQSPRQVFEAIINPGIWWSGEITGKSEKLNDEFSYRYKDLHFSKQKTVEIVPDQKVVWLVTESEINHAEDKNEWTGTKIIFEIFEQDNKTQLRFTHVGLIPQIECFENCSKAWSQLIQEGLFTLITTGEGKPIVLA
jgi:hypothetical protein